MGVCCIKDLPQIEDYDNTIPLKLDQLLDKSSENCSNRPSLPVLRKSFKNKAPVVDNREKEPVDQEADLGEFQVKTDSDYFLINSSLNNHFIFKNLSKDQQDQVIEAMKFLSLGPQQTVVEQDKPGKHFFIIASGACEVLVNETQVNVLQQGDCFGEMALLTDKPRTATVRTLENSSFWGLDNLAFRNALQKIKEEYFERNKKFLDQARTFQGISHVQRGMLLELASTVAYSEGQKIVKEGESGELFFVILDGKVECSINGKAFRCLDVGEYFGEFSFLFKQKRSATVTAVDDTQCLVISGEDLIQALGGNLSQVIYKNVLWMVMRKSKIISSLTEDKVEAIIEALTIHSYPSNTKVIHQGTCKKDLLFIVLKGSLKSAEGDLRENFSILEEEDFIKQESSVFPEYRSIEQCDIACINIQSFNAAIGGNLDQLTSDSEILKVFKKISFLRGLSTEKLSALIKSLSVAVFQPGECIFKQGSSGDCFFIVKSGKVDIIKDDVLIRQINKLDYFGERSILFNDFRTATVKAENQVECWVLSKSVFFLIIDEKIRMRLASRIELQDDAITFEDLAVIKKLGLGMFGNVYLCAHKQKRNLYALKSIDRCKIDNKKIQQSLILERKILMQLDHSFILKLVKTFKDTKRVYFLTEYVRGQDLFDVIRKIGLLSNEDSLFYTACLLLIFEHLHERDIVYRDLKPENVMIDEEGYPKLIDFGTAKIVQGRTFTMIGTPHYMAPEVILGKGYGISVDYWSIGIILYEFMCGGVPFGENECDNYNIYEKILQGKLFYPDYAEITENAKQMIEQFLSKNPAMRVGGGVENLKKHPWFQGLDWEAIWDRTAEAPHRPEILSFAHDIEKVLKVANDHRRTNSDRNGQEIESDPLSWDHEF